MRESLKELAFDLVKLYAERQKNKGYAFGPDTPWQQEFEENFPYDETPDQLQATEEIKRDMELDRPMDRLLCGDVGYGKTEVALRAAFKAVIATASRSRMLAPTTILASAALQHADAAAWRASRCTSDVLSPLPHRPRSRRRRCAGIKRRRNRHHRRHAQAAGQRCAVPQPRACSSSMRSSASAWATRNSIKNMKETGGRAHDVGHADSAHAPHVHGRHSRHEPAGNAAAGALSRADLRDGISGQRDP